MRRFYCVWRAPPSSVSYRQRHPSSPLGRGGVGDLPIYREVDPVRGFGILNIDRAKCRKKEACARSAYGYLTRQLPPSFFGCRRRPPASVLGVVGFGDYPLCLAGDKGGISGKPSDPCQISGKCPYSRAAYVNFPFLPASALGRFWAMRLRRHLSVWLGDDRGAGFWEIRHLPAKFRARKEA